jgi:hypothetical protein
VGVAVVAVPPSPKFHKYVNGPTTPPLVLVLVNVIGVLGQKAVSLAVKLTTGCGYTVITTLNVLVTPPFVAVSVTV